MKCPFCGKTNIAKILYGLPAFSDTLEQELKAGKKVLGGCCITEIDPAYHCNECNKKFGSPARVFDSKGKHLNIIGNISSIEFNIGGFFYGNDCVFFEINEFDINVTVNHIGRPLKTDESGHFERKVSVEEWDKLTNKLFNKLFIHEWDDDYNDPSILDGEQWAVTITLTSGNTLEISGSNAYPALWNDFKKIIRPYFIEAGLKL